jgi:hypothetical protein
VYFQQTYDLREIRIKDYAKRGIDISNALPPGGEGLDRKNPEVSHLMDEQKQMVVSMGQMLGGKFFTLCGRHRNPKQKVASLAVPRPWNAPNASEPTRAVAELQEHM